MFFAPPPSPGLMAHTLRACGVSSEGHPGPALFYVKWEVLVWWLKGSKMPFIATTALQVFPQQFPFFFSLWAWGEVQLAAHMLGIHALLILPPGCGCSVSFVLTLPLFKWLASALQSGKRKPRLLSISCHQNMSQRKRCCSLWLPWQMVSWSRLQKATTVGKRIKWACRKLWGPLAVC